MPIWPIIQESGRLQAAGTEEKPKTYRPRVPILISADGVGVIMFVCDILREKGSALFSIDGDAPVSAAVSLMRKQKTGALLVTDEQGRIDGLFTRRKLIQAYRRTSVTEVNRHPVRDLMLRRLVTCGAEESLRSVMGRMSATGADYTVAIADLRPLSVLSLSDIIDSRLHEAEQQAAHADGAIFFLC